MTTKVRSSVLADTAVTPEKYGGTQTLQTITVDAQGRITHAANITSGVVTADTTGQGASILVPSIRFNALGQIVAATNTTIRSATTSVTGVVQLVDSVSSTSTTSAATANAVKTAYDAAQANTGAALITALNASNISSGTLPAARLSGSYTGITGVGTLSAGSIPASLITGLYPVGSIYINASVATNPGTLLGFGTWVAFGAGRVMVGFNAANALFDTAEETGGSADSSVVSHTHTATVSETPHSHPFSGFYNVGGIGPVGGGANLGTSTTLTTSTASTVITVSNSTEGSSGTNANYQPYITVYMWKRTA